MNDKEMILPVLGLIRAMVERAILEAQGRYLSDLEPQQRAKEQAAAVQFLKEWGIPARLERTISPN